jgi:hypothetical protein
MNTSNMFTDNNHHYAYIATVGVVMTLLSGLYMFVG